MKRPLALMAPEPEDDDADDILAAEELAAQARRAIDQTHHNYSTQPRFAWDSVHEIVGNILPWQWWVIAAQQGNGKSTIVQNLLDDFVAQGKQVYVLALEESPEGMILVQAALECDLKVSHVRANRWERLPQGARAQVEQSIRERVTRQNEHGSAVGGVRYREDRDISAAKLPAVWKDAHRWGADLVLIDHIHRLAEADHREISRVAKMLSEMARDFHIPALVTAQLNRGAERDPVRPMLPPVPSDIQGSAHIEQEAHVIFGAYRPLGVFTPDDLMQARKGLKNPYELAKPNTVGLKLMKDRIDGEYTGKIWELDYTHGRITCPMTQDRKNYERRNDL